MRLAAIYLPSNENFKEDTINFGGRYNYFITKNNSEYKLKRILNENFIENFFSNEISNISVIVGKNGVGKTYLLKKILKSDDLLLVFESDYEYLKKQWLISSSKNYLKPSHGIKYIDNKEKDELDIAFQELKKEEKNHYNNNYRIYEKPTYYFYSPLSNYNLSTKYIDDFTVNDDSIFTIQSEILQRQVSFLMQKKLINGLKEIYEGFPSYDKVKIKLIEFINPDLSLIDFRLYSFFKNNSFFKNKDLNKLKNDNEFQIAYKQDSDNGNFINIFTILSERSKQSSGRKRIYIEIYIRAILSLISLTGTSKLNLVFAEINSLIVDDVFENDRRFNKLIRVTFDKVKKINEKLNEHGIIDSLEELEELIKEILTNLPEDQYFSLLEEKINKLNKSYFNFLHKTESFINDFIIDYEIPFLKFETNKNLSQGEEYLLNLFSAIYSKVDLGNKENIILLLDEPDLGFHPKWKKKLVESFVTVLPALIKGLSARKFNDIQGFENENVLNRLQIIFTTHDPLTLSDIPNKNIVYLDKNDNSFFVKKTNKPEKSFGANLTDLLADSFYINDGLIGDFAKRKINETIEWLNQSNDNIVEFEDKNQNEIHRKVINTIDEPILKIKLLEMYSEKIGISLRNQILDEQIKYLESLKND
ncbi:AAA family ATPase [Flavobacterium stagni]|uniref:ATPase AAA-type core domain-containing protein n=1 Tax=Flavobacterium stagni TaxID=2506421 RepID=A0A4Q1K344_9FLAO|nr:AAA family ATPase [Flavobacterium stagni]RXR20193.1 hypothetical protein EQG61_13160 [Flavobacterium stagni]